MAVEYNFRGFLGKRVLITGDIGAGKTRLTLKLLEEAIELGFDDEITIIDMAPAMIEVKGMIVGGRLLELSDKLRGTRYLLPSRVESPRLSAESASELLHLVNLNEKRIRPLLQEYVKNPTRILFVNDLSIYLQSGDDEPVLSSMRAAETFIANGYCGRALEPDFRTGVSNMERRLMERIANEADVMIKL